MIHQEPEWEFDCRAICWHVHDARCSDDTVRICDLGSLKVLFDFKRSVEQLHHTNRAICAVAVDFTGNTVRRWHVNIVEIDAITGS